MKENNKKILCTITTGMGASMIGIFAKQDGSIINTIVLTLGILLLVFSAIKLSK